MKKPQELCEMANEIKTKTKLVPFWLCCGVGTDLKHTLFEIRLFKEEDLKDMEKRVFWSTDELAMKMKLILEMKPVKSYKAEVFFGDHEEQVKQKVEKGFMKILDEYTK